MMEPIAGTTFRHVLNFALVSDNGFLLKSTPAAESAQNEETSLTCVRDLNLRWLETTKNSERNAKTLVGGLRIHKL